MKVDAEVNAATARDSASYEGEADAADAPYTSVYSSALQWDPQGSQAERLAVPAAPVHGDILLAKLSPGQSIELEAHAVKGVGKDHAKFSPVETAVYRLLPEVRLSETAPFMGVEADELVATCPMGVFDIEDLKGARGISHPATLPPSRSPIHPFFCVGGKRKAIVARPRDCTVCRECLRPEGWAERVVVERIADHYIFEVESTGALPASELVVEALRVLSAKAQTVLNCMDAAAGSAAGPPETGGIPLLPGAKARMGAAMKDPSEEAEILE
jgi:DNA-directed RNA polymerases I and III subunit RPAC1